MRKRKYSGTLYLGFDRQFKMIDLGTESNLRRFIKFANKELREEPCAESWMITDGETNWHSDGSINAVWH